MHPLGHSHWEQGATNRGEKEAEGGRPTSQLAAGELGGRNRLSSMITNGNEELLLASPPATPLANPDLDDRDETFGEEDDDDDESGQKGVDVLVASAPDGSSKELNTENLKSFSVAQSKSMFRSNNASFRQSLSSMSIASSRRFSEVPDFEMPTEEELAAAKQMRAAKKLRLLPPPRSNHSSPPLTGEYQPAL